MARGFAATRGSATTDRITLATSRAFPSTFSMSAWVKRNGAGGANFGRVFDHTGDNDNNLFYDAGNTRWQFSRSWSVSVQGQWVWPVATSTGVWYHMVVTYDDGATTNDPILYLNGADQVASFTETLAPSGTVGTTGAVFVLGNRAGADRVFDGDIAEFAVWSVILTAAEAATLAKGYPASQVRPSALLEYEELLRENVNRKQAASTITGTAVQTHSPTRRPVAQIIPFPTPAAPGGFQAAWARGSNVVIGAGVAA